MNMAFVYNEIECCSFSNIFLINLEKEFFDMHRK